MESVSMNQLLLVNKLITICLKLLLYKRHMFIIQNYSVAILFCIITMLCWGSWANTQKLAEKTWRFELFYWDYVIGLSLIHISEPTRLLSISYAVFCLKK